MLADAADALGLELPRPSAVTAESLRVQLPLTATVSNPLDYTTPIWGVPDRTEPVFSTLFADGYDAAVIIQDYPAAGLDESKPFYRNDSISFLNAAAAAGLPAAVCSTIAENLDAETRNFLVARGVAPMQGIGDCVRAIAAAAAYGVARRQLLANIPPPLIPAGDADPDDRLTDPMMLDEATAKSCLTGWQVDVPEALVLTTLPAAPLVLPSGLDYPLVAKALSPDLSHKSEIGAVIVDIESAEEMLAALAGIDAKVTQHAPTARRTGFLIEAMQPPPLGELMLSLRRDPTFGLVLTLASGGVLVELLDDSVTMLLPASDEVITAAINRLAIAQVLGGYRGAAMADFEPVIGVINRLAKSLADDPALSLVEINPLFVYADTVIAVDAVIMRISA